MASMQFGRVPVVILFLVLCGVSSERMKNKIYETIDGAAACFRRLNGTHQFGCTSHRLGNVGIVHLIQNRSDLQWLLDDGEAIPYMAVMHPLMFTKKNLLKLRDSNKVNGIALLNNGTHRPNAFTHEDTCPNRYSGLSTLDNQTCSVKYKEWNPEGTKVMLMDWGFPIFYVSSESAIRNIELCYYNFNSDQRNKEHAQSLCAMEMSSFMFASVNSATCIRRSNMITNFNPVRFCDPLGDRNIWSTLFARNKSVSQLSKVPSIFVIATRLDTSSLFDGVTPGAVTPTTGIVALLSTAYILSKIFDRTESVPSNKNVLFALFNGESFDYIGSSRMVWDMKQRKFPTPLDDDVLEQPPLLKLKDLALFVELSHLTNQFEINGTSTLVFHTPEKNRIKTQLTVDSFMSLMADVGSKFGLSFTKKTDGKLPPASLQTFIAQSDHIVPGVLIADHMESYTTKYYHSIFDDSIGLKYIYQNGSIPPPNSIQAFVANLSTTLSYTIYNMLTDQMYNDSVEADLKIIDELFHCYVDKVNCSIFQQATYKAVLQEKPASLYVGVNWHGPNQITTLTGQALAYLTGLRVNKSEKDCRNNPNQQIYQYIWMQGNTSKGESGICIQTTMNYSVATSPAFEIPDYNWSSGKFSTWTESVWQDLSVRVFLKPSRQHELRVFFIGAIVFALSFVIVYFLNSRSHTIFGNTLGTGAC